MTYERIPVGWILRLLSLSDSPSFNKLSLCSATAHFSNAIPPFSLLEKPRALTFKTPAFLFCGFPPECPLHKFPGAFASSIRPQPVVTTEQAVGRLSSRPVPVLASAPTDQATDCQPQQAALCWHSCQWELCPNPQGQLFLPGLTSLSSHLSAQRESGSSLPQLHRLYSMQLLSECKHVVLLSLTPLPWTVLLARTPHPQHKAF